MKEQLEQINLKNQNDDEIKSEITKKKKEFSYAQQMYENARANYNRLEGKLESAKNNFYVAQKNYDNLGGIEDEAGVGCAGVGCAVCSCCCADCSGSAGFCSARIMRR